MTAFIAWETKATGSREFGLLASVPGKKCCKVLSLAGDAAAPTNTTGQTVSAIASLPAGAVVLLQAKQSSGAPLELAGGGMQIAWLGN